MTQYPNDIIFISYRTADSNHASGRLHDSLENFFGANTTFRDKEDIGAGSNFVTTYEERLRESKVALIVIGNRYVDLENEDGQKRIKSKGDHVRNEVSIALKHQDRIKTIPVLVDGAKMPSTDELPDDLKGLCLLNAFQLSNVNWTSDFKSLALKIQNTVSKYARPASDIPQQKQPARSRKKVYQNRPAKQNNNKQNKKKKYFTSSIITTLCIKLL